MTEMTWREKHAAKYGDKGEKKAVAPAPLFTVGDKVQITYNGKTILGEVTEQVKAWDRMVSVRIPGYGSVQSFGRACVHAAKV